MFEIFNGLFYLAGVKITQAGKGFHDRGVGCAGVGRKVGKQVGGLLELVQLAVAQSHLFFSVADQIGESLAVGLGCLIGDFFQPVDRCAEIFFHGRGVAIELGRFAQGDQRLRGGELNRVAVGMPRLF